MRGRGNGFVDDQERQCKGKTQYATKAAAKLKLKRSRSFDGRDGVKAYLCPWCSCYHIGHKAGRKKPADSV